MSENAPGVLHVVQVVLVWNSPPADPAPERLQQLAALLWQRHSRGSMRDSNSGSGENCGGSAEAPLVHSVWANYQSGSGNVILGPAWRLLHPVEGDAYSWQVKSCNTCLFRSPVCCCIQVLVCGALSRIRC